MRDRIVATLRSDPALLDGLSWSAFALVLAYCALSAFNVAVLPGAGAGPDFAERAAAGLARVPVFLITGATALVTCGDGAERIRARGSRAHRARGARRDRRLRGCVARPLPDRRHPTAEGPAFMLRVFSTWIAPAALLTAGCVLHLRARAAREEANEGRTAPQRAGKAGLETRLRLLQAQIEPHFLFNTLSNIRRLCQNDAAGGRAMLAQLTRYLRAALQKMRENDATLATRSNWCRPISGLQKIRMGERLQVTIRVPQELRGASVPPMMLATLVENAIKHGITPLTEGGSIKVSRRSRRRPC
jgi:hypothetical protein